MIKPDTAEKIKEDLPTFDGWATQNGANCDKIDSLFRAANSTYTLNWTASTTNPTLGASGFTEGKYVRLWPRLVLIYFRIFTGGAGFATGTGVYGINLPFALDPDLVAFGGESLPLGRAIYQDSSAIASSTIFLASYLGSLNIVVFRPTAGIVWTNTFPVAPEQNDRLSGYLLYPTQDA